MIDVQVQGLIETQRNIERAIADLHGPPMLDGMRDATLIVERRAKQNAPVDTGRLRASITPEIRAEGEAVLGVVGSNVKYAPFMELGTRPHFPPPAALVPWVHRKFGLSGGAAYRVAFLVARKISERGLAPRRYLQKAFDDNQTQIELRIGRAVSEIVLRANE